MGQYGLRNSVRLEATCSVCLCICCVAFWVERRLTTLGGNNGYVSARIFEDVVGCSKFFQPEASFFAGVAKLVVRCENHQNIHVVPLCCQPAISGLSVAKVLEKA
jgi:hypothetical protein